MNRRYFTGVFKSLPRDYCGHGEFGSRTPDTQPEESNVLKFTIINFLYLYVSRTSFFGAISV